MMKYNISPTEGYSLLPTHFKKEPNKLNCYICCFCKKPTLENMWEKYADKRKGVCLEFDISNNNCRKFFTENAPHYFRLYQVIYDEFKLKGMIEYLVHMFFTELYHKTKDIVKLKGHCYGFLLYAVYLYKVKHAEEEEVRLFVDNHNAKAFTTQYRDSDGISIPYISSGKCNEDLGIPTLPPIKRVIVRSEANIDEVKSIIDDFEQNITVELL